MMTEQWPLIDYVSFGARLLFTVALGLFVSWATWKIIQIARRK